MAEIFIDAAAVPFIGSFLFVFAIVFGLLSYSKMGFSKNVNVIIAMVFGLFSAVYEPFRTGLFNVLPILVIPLVILFFMVFIKKIFEPKKGKEEFDAFPPVLLLAISLALLGALWDRIGFTFLGISSSNVLWILGITVVLIFFMAVYYHKPAKEQA